MTGGLAGVLAVLIIVFPPPPGSGVPEPAQQPATSDSSSGPVSGSPENSPLPDLGHAVSGPTDGVANGLNDASNGVANGVKDGVNGVTDGLGDTAGSVNLSGWKLTIPTASDKGTAASVNPAEDGATPWLSKNDNGAVTLWAPVNGSTTPNSTHARTELVSLTNFTAGSSGRHSLHATVSVRQVPNAKQDIILGQIHGAADISSVSFVMLHYDTGTIRVVVKQGQSGPTSEKYPLISGVPLNSPFDYTITDTGDGNLSFTATHGSDTRTATAAIPAPFRGATVRFQAGDYQQAESGTGVAADGSAAGSSAGGRDGGGDGGRVTFHYLIEN
jgi:hypothetical protein